ncbi:MAG TPA: hypothetical protein VM050_10835 [Patescibacteria group bacterium]|nr:hypothetical protein [Patescibacteria group bacterium]
MREYFRNTSLCPYTGECSSYRSIVNSERWMEKALTQLRRTGENKLPVSESGYTDHMLETNLMQLRRVKERCYNHNGRCLRFWQFDKKSKKIESLNGLRERYQVAEDVPTPIMVENPAVGEAE